MSFIYFGVALGAYIAMTGRGVKWWIAALNAIVWPVVLGVMLDEICVKYLNK